MYFESYRNTQTYYSKRDNICGAHFHRSAEILYVLSGQKPARLNGTEYLLERGQVLFCQPYAVHAFLPCPGGEQIVVAVPADYCRRFESFCETHEPVFPVLTDEDGTLLRLMTELENTDNEVLFEGLVNCLFGVYLERASFRATTKAPDRSQIRLIADYIDKHYASPVSLSELSAQFGYSPNYFSALFKKYFMTGVAQYINSVRIQKSLPLLKTQKISAVYFLCGFQSPQQYFLNFRKIFGCTPYEYLHAGKPKKNQGQ